MLRKRNDCESLEISQENVYDGKLKAYRVQTATLLQRELTKDSFWNMCRKIAALKRVF